MRLDQIKLEANVEDAPFADRRAEWAGRSVVYAVREEGTMKEPYGAVAERHRPVEAQAVGGGAINEGAEARIAKLCCSAGLGEERGAPGFLHRHVEAEDGRIGHTEDTEHAASPVNHRHGARARRAAVL